MKNMKYLIALAALVGVVSTSHAQFRSGTPIVKDVVGGTVSTNVALTTAGTTNLTTVVKIGNTGFAVTGYFVAAGAATSNINVQAYTSHNGTDFSTSTTVLGNFTANGTTAARQTLFVPNTTIGNIAAIKLVLTNQNAQTITVSNLSVSSF